MLMWFLHKQNPSINTNCERKRMIYSMLHACTWYLMCLLPTVVLSVYFFAFATRRSPVVHSNSKRQLWEVVAGKSGFTTRVPISFPVSWWAVINRDPTDQHSGKHKMINSVDLKELTCKNIDWFRCYNSENLSNLLLMKLVKMGKTVKYNSNRMWQ